ncbi:MAG TPA: TonB-dependent receptor [Burkholderiaceae bacterium]|nr:TonB-dependent receptor [Burkholderiaceae bacterium]
MDRANRTGRRSAAIAAPADGASTDPTRRRATADAPRGATIADAPRDATTADARRAGRPRVALAALAALAAAAAPLRAETLPDVSVTATPLGDTPTRSSRPISVLRDAELDRRLGGSLGETLERLPGVTSSGFGTAAGRPVVRGQSGPRVGVVDNGLDTLDVSALSPDHAVPLDPLSLRQVEVLRGPATLLYGSGSIGGLVNGVSERIPTTALRGTSGEALAAGDSASRGALGSLRLRGGTAGRPGAQGSGSLNWTLGGFARDAGDYRIPGTAVRGDPSSASGRLPNSDAESRGASGGLSWTDRWGAVGVAHSTLDARYGIPSEDGVFIDQSNRRTEGLVELDAPVPGLESLRLRTAEVRYRHSEIERASGEVGTRFDSRGRDTRLETVHAPLLGVRGALGVQSRTRALGASGDEAYVPSARERERALFWVGERAFGPARIELGVRAGRADRDPDAASGAAARRFDLGSWSLGGVVPIAGPIALSANYGVSQRAPAIEELYANGPHAATRTFEIGDASLSKERARNLEVALRQDSGPVRWKAGAFEQRFSSYVTGVATDVNGDGVADRVEDDGTIVNDPTDPGAGELSRLAILQAPARFRGLEAELSWQPAGSPWTVRAFGDRVRAAVDGFGAAPRTPPERVGLSLDYAQGPWSGFVSALHAARQDRAGELESPTPGWTRVDAEVARTWRLSADRSATFFVQGRNLTDADIRLATSFVRDRVPMPGRSVFAGLRVRM